MEKNKTKFKDKLTVKNINTTFGIIIFVLVFLFTFLFTSELKEHWVILLSVFGGAIALVGIAWLAMFLIIRNKKIKSDPNKQKINQALDELKKKEEQAKYSQTDESNN